MFYKKTNDLILENVTKPLKILYLNYVCDILCS